MLTFSIRLTDIGEELLHSGRIASFGESRIEAFASNQLEMSVCTDTNGSNIWIGEDADPRPGTRSDPWDDRHRQFTEFEGVKIRLHRLRGKPVIEVTRTAAGSTPLYISTDQDSLTASWRFEEAVQVQRPPKPNIDACRIFLEHNASQVREQVIDGVFMLWPGESLTFSGGQLQFREVDTPEIVLPSTLLESARVSEEFLRLIAQSLRRNLSKSKHPMIELSGGLDSACVAVAACSVTERANSYGAVHEGAMGVQQRRRRRELVELLGVNDFEYPSYEYTPIRALGVEECTITPFDDNHRLPCVYAVDEHPVGDIDLIITGIGGDELMMENTFFRQEWEVPGNICTSAIVASAARADMFMRRGIWPSNPLISQSVVNFCRALPQKMRERRLLNVLSLARAGLSDGFFFPRYYEHYGNAMQREAALFDYDAALSQSIVADHGIADISSLLGRAREASLGGFSYKLIGELYNLLKLETILRRYVS